MTRPFRDAPRIPIGLLAILLPAWGCAGAAGRPPVVAASPPGETATPPPAAPAPPAATAGEASSVAAGALPGMPPVLDPRDIYSEDRPGKLSRVVKEFP